MGKDKPGAKKNETPRCGGCRNFDPDKKGGWCRHKEKKRAADDKSCGSYKKR
jgi:hypothetical protein